MAAVAAPPAIVITVPEVVAGLVEVLSAVVLLALRFVLVGFIGGLLVAMAHHVPFVGGYLARGIQDVVNEVASLLDGAIGALFSLIDAWWNGIGQIVDYYLHAMENVGGAAYDAVSGLRNVVLPALADAILHPIHLAIAKLEAIGGALSDELHAGIDALTHSIASLAERAFAGIDKLTSDLANLTHEVYSRGIDRIDAILDSIIPEIRREVGALEDRVGGIAHDLERWIVSHADLLAALSALLAAVSVGRIITAVRESERFGPKRDLLCKFDPDELAGIVGLALTLPTFALIYETVKVASDAAVELADAAKDSLPS